MVRVACGIFVALAAVVLTRPLHAGPMPGAIFTTVVDGSEVNFNHYPSKEAVYLDGGPGPGAPQGAAGLNDGTYVFQVTNPSGRVLLSTDPARCRQFTVSGGIITAVVPAGGCEHATGVDIDHGAATVQLVPYNDTPNPCGVYKVWVTLASDFLNGCIALGENDGLNVVDCGFASGDDHGFVPSNSKTDNFKVKAKSVVEIDTRFFDGSGNILDGRGISWTDPNGASNNKWSYYNPALQINHEAHVEAVEDGVHSISIANQTGCTVGAISVAGTRLPKSGPQTVSVQIKPGNRDNTVFVDVSCN
jgi:hypothetical protein